MNQTCVSCKHSSYHEDTGRMCQNVKNSGDDYYDFIKPFVDDEDTCGYWELNDEYEDEHPSGLGKIGSTVFL